MDQIKKLRMIILNNIRNLMVMMNLKMITIIAQFFEIKIIQPLKQIIVNTIKQIKNLINKINNNKIIG